MRSGGESWTEIAKALGIDEDECRLRLAELAGAIADPEQGRAPAPSSSDTVRDTVRRSMTRRHRAAVPTASSDDKTWSPRFQYTQQKHHEAFAVATLARTYAPNGFADLGLKADHMFDDLDCKLLSLLKAKHEADKRQALQAEFANATGRMVDARLLQRRWTLPMI